MKATLGAMVVCWCLLLGEASGAPSSAWLGLGAGLDLQDAELAGEPAIGPSFEGFIAWQGSRMSKLRVGLHWAPFAGPGGCVSGSHHSAAQRAGSGSCYGASEDIDMLDVRFTALWPDQRHRRVQAYAGAGLGAGVLLFERGPAQLACVFAPTFGLGFWTGGHRLSVEMSVEMVIGEDTRFGVIPVRVLVPF